MFLFYQDQWLETTLFKKWNKKSKACIKAIIVNHDWVYGSIGTASIVLPIFCLLVVPKWFNYCARTCILFALHVCQNLSLLE